MKPIKMLMIAALTILSVSVFAQDSTKQKMNEAKQKNETLTYSCPMHPDITSENPGKCSKCGMDMKEKTTLVYSCPMKCEGDKTYDKPGKCPKCGMDLTKSKMEPMKMYCCPMHSDMTSDKPGKCSKCGMDMKEKATVVYSCPMKCEGDKTYDKPGKCPKCGMDLVKSNNKPKAKKD